VYIGDAILSAAEVESRVGMVSDVEGARRVKGGVAGAGVKGDLAVSSRDGLSSGDGRQTPSGEGKEADVTMTLGEARDGGVSGSWAYAVACAW
jgi:hypothetical protein